MDGFLKLREAGYMVIIDDDVINRELLKNLFASRFSFLEGENGLEGLRIIEQHCHEISAILMDVDMPVMDGIELLKILYAREIVSRIPVFLFTSNGEEDVARDAYEMGVMGVINKPVVPFIAVRRVELVVELFQAREALDRKVQDQQKELQQNVQTIDALHRSTIEALASVIEFRDLESGMHTNRIYGITKLLLSATDMGRGFSDEEIENMAVGSIMHDVGKIAISDVILNKPGKLTEREYEIMKEHTVKGSDLMDQLNLTHSHPSYWYARDIARHHHERWDGNGYPDGLKGSQITPWSQAVSIADVYDALVSPRVYKRAYDPDTALDMIKNGDCGVFGPKLLRSFLQIEPIVRKWYQENQETIAMPVSRGTVQTFFSAEEEQSQQEMVDILLLTAAVKSAYDLIICCNLTKNTFYMMDYDRFATRCVGDDGVFDDLIAGGATSIPESHRQQFKDTFCRENLIKAWAEGKKTVNLEHPQYADDGRLMNVDTSVLFMEDPRNGDLREITLARYKGVLAEAKEERSAAYE